MYVQLAANLARSFLHWHKNSEINFQIVTDLPDQIPADLIDKISIIKVRTHEIGEGFSSKLYLDKLISPGQTLFIDSDCLIFEPLDGVFDRFAGHEVSVVGSFIKSGDWFGDIEAILKKFDLPYLPKFNGGMYYVQKGHCATHVYETARHLEGKYEEIGFTTLRGKPNDEVIMALAMQLHNQSPVADDGSIMSDPQACPGVYQLNVLTGERCLYNPKPPHPLHQSWYPMEKVRPAVVHFLGQYIEHFPYKKEVYRLVHASNGKLSLLHEWKVLLTLQYPEQIKIYFKNLLRSSFHKTFGPRKIKPSNRIG